MKNFLRLASFAFVFCLLCSAGAQQVFYAASGAHGQDGMLYTYSVDANGNPFGTPTSVTLINSATNLGVGITGLAVNPITGVLYGVTANSTLNGNSLKSHLVTINASTGFVTDLGALRLNSNSIGISDITFSSTGTLYGIEASSGFGLATINKTNGTVTTVGSSNFGNIAGGGLAFNSAGDLYASLSGASTTLDRLNPADGTISSSVSFMGSQFGGGFGALAFNSQGTLFGAENNGDKSLPDQIVDVVLEKIDLTGQISFVFDLPDFTDAIAFAPVPEPSTVALIAFGGIGAVALTVYRRRRS